MVYTSIKKLYIIYLQFKFNWVSYFAFAKSSDPILLLLKDKVSSSGWKLPPSPKIRLFCPLLVNKREF